MRKYIRGNIISALQWQIHCQVYQSHAFWEIAHTTSSRNILSAIAVLTGLFFLPEPLKFVDWNCDCIDLCDQIYPGFNWTDYWHPRSSPGLSCRRRPTSILEHPRGPAQQRSHQGAAGWASLWASWAEAQADTTVGVCCVQVETAPFRQHSVAALLL